MLAQEGPASEGAIKLGCHVRLLSSRALRWTEGRERGTYTSSMRREPLAPPLAGRASFGCPQEVFERHVDEGALRVSEELVAFSQFASDVQPTPAFALELRGDHQRAVDVHRLQEADGKARGHRWEAVPGRKQTARLVERSADEPAVDEARRGLVLLAEREACAVRAQTLPFGGR